MLGGCGNNITSDSSYTLLVQPFTVGVCIDNKKPRPYEYKFLKILNKNNIDKIRMQEEEQERSPAPEQGASSEVFDNKTAVPVYYGIGVRLTSRFAQSELGENINITKIKSIIKGGNTKGILSVQILGISGFNVTKELNLGVNDFSSGRIKSVSLSLNKIKDQIYQENIVIAPKLLGFDDNLTPLVGEEGMKRFIAALTIFNETVPVHF